MKVSFAMMMSTLTLTSSVTAFAPSIRKTFQTTTTTAPYNHQQCSTALASSRRDVIASSAAAAAAVALLLNPNAAFADARPMYLTEPTDDFKESEAQRAEFRKIQIKQKLKLQAALDKLGNEANNEDVIAGDVDNIKAIVIEIGGMPLGIKKDDLVKQVRAKKAKGFWPTKCELSYQALIREIAYQQNPNKDKDIGNPL